MNEYQTFDFASLRYSHLKNGFWGHRTENLYGNHQQPVGGPVVPN